MWDFLYGMGRFFLFGFGLLGAALGYLWICGQVHRKWPRLGLALAAVVVAGGVALFICVGVTVYTGSSRIGAHLLLPTYVVSFVGWVIFVFSQKESS